MASDLATILPPGLPLFSRSTATRPMTFLMTGIEDIHKESGTIATCSPVGDAGSTYQISTADKAARTVNFHISDRQHVMRIIKEAHSFRHGHQYRGYAGGADAGTGTEVWHVRLHQGFRGMKYILTVPSESTVLEIKNHVEGQDTGILMDGEPIATMSLFYSERRSHSHYLIHVAKGMDILLAVGVAWIKADEDARAAEARAAAAAASRSDYLPYANMAVPPAPPPMPPSLPPPATG